MDMGPAQQRAVDDEEDLLRLQEEMMALNSRPAAKVTRVTKSTAQEAVLQQEPPPAGSDAPAPALDMAGLLAAMRNVMGDVQERQPSAAEAPPPQLPQAPRHPADFCGGPVPFPAAMHRKQSKFALGRKREQAQPAAPPSMPGEALMQPAATQQPGTISVEAPAAGSRRVTFAAGTAGAAAGALAQSVGDGEASGIDAENRQLLAAMSPQQIEEARSEVLSRLPPSALEFLKRRAASKAAAPATSAVTAAAPSAAAARGAPHPAPAAAAPRGVARAPEAPSAPAPAPGAGRYRGPRSKAAAGKEGTAAQQGVGAEQGSNASTLAGRLRFDVGGEVVGIKPGVGVDPEECHAGRPQEVVRRDPIRQDEGVAGEGYTLEEACTLARSSLPQQRVLALRLLGAVLAHSRPSMHSRREGLLGRLGLSLPAPAPALQWGDVWRHALHAADVAVVVRLALDDSNLAVVGAAAQALMPLVGPREEEEAALEVADSSPLTGWPAVPLRHMQRPSAIGGWVVVPARPQQRALGDEGADGEEEDLDERQVAKVDPLLGLLHMDLLPRCAFTLGVSRAPGAVAPLLCVLIRCCQAGKDVADQIVSCPGMCAALQRVLDTPPPGSNADAADVACHAARPRALRLLRQLAQASKLAARTLLETGLTRHLVSELLRVPAPTTHGASPEGAGAHPTTDLPGAGAHLAHLGVQTEALRAWRAYALHGLYLVHLDDAFPAICRLFAPSCPPELAPSDPQESSPSGGAAAMGQGLGIASLHQWAAAREAYLAVAILCQHAARCAPHETMISSKAAASLARQTLDWLQALPLQAMLSWSCHVAQQEEALQAVGALPASAGCYHPSPFPALTLPRSSVAQGDASAPAAAAVAPAPAAYVVLSMLSAALHFLGTFWAEPGWQEGGECDEAREALRRAGLLVFSTTQPDGEAHAARSGGSGELTVGESPSPSTSCLECVTQLLQQSLAALGTQPGGADADVSMGAGTGAAAANLAVAVARLEAALQLISGPAGASARAVPAPVAAAVLGPTLTQHAAACLLSFCSPTSGFDATMTQPWDCARWQGAVQLARAAATALAMTSPGAGGELARADVAGAVLSMLPPGDDSAALLALTGLVSPQGASGASSMRLAAAALERLEGSALGGVAGGAVTEQGTPTYPRPQLPSPHQLTQLLVAGCAGTWLGLVKEAEGAGGELSTSTLPLPTAAVLRPEGSRLPLPGDWPLREVPIPPPASALSADSAAAAGATLLLGLVLEELGVQSMGMVPVGERLRSAVQLVFAPHADPAELEGILQRAQHAPEEPWRDSLVRWCMAALLQRYCNSTFTEVLPPPTCGGGSSSSSSGGAPAGPAASSLCTAAPAEDLAAGSSSVGESSVGQGRRGWQVIEAKGLAEQFAAVSFGDPLFGAAVATLLRRDVPLDIQLEVLQTLAGEHALHLLPPLPSLPGDAAAYLDPPLLPLQPTQSSGGAHLAASPAAGTSGSGSNGLGAQEGATLIEAPSGPREGERKAVDAYVKLVIEGSLDKCLREERGGAPPAVLPIVVHRLAQHIFGAAGTARPAGAASSAGQRGWREAALLRLLRGCCSHDSSQGAAATEAPRRAALLLLLLSWDCSRWRQQGADIESISAPVPARVDMLHSALRSCGDAELEGSVNAALGSLLR